MRHQNSVSEPAQAERRCSGPRGRRSHLACLCLVLGALAAGLADARAFAMLSSNQIPFLNVDHAPMGACSTLAYGLTGASGPWDAIRGDYCGLGMSSGAIPYFNGGGGVIIALSGSSGVQALPFVASPASIASSATYFSDAAVHRWLTPGADQWTIDNAGLTFTHYTPAWSMPSLDAATLSDRRRFFLPATWMVFTVHNTNTTAQDLYVGLPIAATQRSFANGAYQGFTAGEATLAVQTGSGDLLSGPSLRAALNGVTQGFAFHLHIPPGQTSNLTVVVGFYRSAVVDSRIPASYYYTSLFGSIDSVIDAAFAECADAQARCQQLASAMANAGLNFYRQFLACHALHSYMANTACLIDPAGGVHWWVTEGAYNYINTFDLTVDLAFYDSLMQPWALRNVLDTFSGALTNTGYSFDHPLYDPASNAQVSPHGFSFHHDLGNWPISVAPGTDPVFDDYMGQEQLQNWILSAGLYWSRTSDHAWLTNNATLLQTCLSSMLARDNPNPAARNGITKYVNQPELTTFDDLDSSLRNAPFSGRLAVRNWACYLALQAMFGQIGDAADATTCQTMAAVAAQTLVNAWNSYRSSLGYLPALLDGSNTAGTIPLVEGLAYPAQMGLTNALDRTGGPYVALLQVLSNHLAAVLVPGKCLNATSGAWDMTTSTGYGNDHKIWHSKVYIAQYVAETVLGLSGSTVNGTVDQIHASIMAQNASFYEFSDENDATGANRYVGGCHYPRGITSALWWLNATNHPGYPVATAPPAAPGGLSALPGNHQVVLLWNGVALAAGYNLKRATTPGGPYSVVTNGIAGASYTDTALLNGLNYYYVLRATNSIGEGLPSPEVRAMPYGPVPATGTNISAFLKDGNVIIAWPSNYVGWVLQTNAVDVANQAYWGDLPASTTNQQMSFPLANPSLPVEFFRLRHP